MANRDDLLAAALLGAAGGMRTFVPLAALSLRGHADLGGTMRLIVGGAAAGELGAEKLPQAPSRLEPLGLGGRTATAALAGLVIAGPAGSALAAAVANRTAGAGFTPREKLGKDPRRHPPR